MSEESAKIQVFFCTERRRVGARIKNASGKIDCEWRDQIYHDPITDFVSWMATAGIFITKFEATSNGLFAYASAPVKSIPNMTESCVYRQYMLSGAHSS